MTVDISEKYVKENIRPTRNLAKWQLPETRTRLGHVRGYDDSNIVFKDFFAGFILGGEMKNTSFNPRLCHETFRGSWKWTCFPNWRLAFIRYDFFLLLSEKLFTDDVGNRSPLLDLRHKTPVSKITSRLDDADKSPLPNTHSPPIPTPPSPRLPFSSCVRSAIRSFYDLCVCLAAGPVLEVETAQLSCTYVLFRTLWADECLHQ